VGRAEEMGFHRRGRPGGPWERPERDSRFRETSFRRNMRAELGWLFWLLRTLWKSTVILLYHSMRGWVRNVGSHGFQEMRLEWIRKQSSGS